MNNDKAFVVYALTLTAGFASVITASVIAGFTTLPTTGVFLSHLAMSLAFRLGYKSFGGFDWIYRVAEIAGMITTQPTSPSNLGAEASVGAEAAS